MSPEAFALAMKNAVEIANSDPFSGHEEADNIMCELLEDFGYGDGVRIYKALERGYEL